MKKIIASVLAVLLVFSLWGCRFLKQDENSVSFYYQRSGTEFVYGQEDGVIASESRDISGNRDNLRYLLTLYFHGPLDTALSSPFPAGTALSDLKTEDTTLRVTLNSVFTQLQNMDLTIACTCLAMTCFDLCDAEAVLIEASANEEAPAVSVTITRDNYLLIGGTPETIPASES